MSLNNMSLSLNNLYEKYKDQPEVLSKMEEYLNKQFPHALELFVTRINRKQNLEKQSQLYIDKFLNNPEQQYFYNHQTDLFIFYNGENYSIINEDTIWHLLLSDISTKEELIPWKHKIKNLAIKHIKEKPITQSIPESNTIQYVIQHLTPTLFRSKSEAKYFLTVLGDNILKKSTNITHFTRLESKDFLTCLQDLIQYVLGCQCNPISSIKFKYYNQDFNNCSIFSFNDSVKITSCWNDFLKSHILDLIAVASHYSHQFQNANKYIQNHCFYLTCIFPQYIWLNIRYLVLYYILKYHILSTKSNYFSLKYSMVFSFRL